METYRSPLLPKEIEALQESLKYHAETEGSSAITEFLDIPWITQNARIYRGLSS